MNPRTKDGEEIDWAAARDAAEQLLRVCNDINYVAPDNGAGQQKYLNRAAVCVSNVATALKLVRKAGTP